MLDDTYCHSRGISQWGCLAQAVGGGRPGAGIQVQLSCLLQICSKRKNLVRKPLLLPWVSSTSRCLITRINLNIQDHFLQRLWSSGHLWRRVGVGLLIAGHAGHAYDAHGARDGAGDGPLVGLLGPGQGARHLPLLHLTSQSTSHLNKLGCIHFTVSTSHLTLVQDNLINDSHGFPRIRIWFNLSGSELFPHIIGSTHRQAPLKRKTYDTDT